MIILSVLYLGEFLFQVSQKPTTRTKEINFPEDNQRKSHSFSFHIVPIKFPSRVCACARVSTTLWVGLYIDAQHAEEADRHHKHRESNRRAIWSQTVVDVTADTQL